MLSAAPLREIAMALAFCAIPTASPTARPLAIEARKYPVSVNSLNDKANLLNGKANSLHGYRYSLNGKLTRYTETAGKDVAKENKKRSF